MLWKKINKQKEFPWWLNIFSSAWKNRTRSLQQRSLHITLECYMYSVLLCKGFHAHFSRLQGPQDTLLVHYSFNYSMQDFYFITTPAAIVESFIGYFSPNSSFLCLEPQTWL